MVTRILHGFYGTEHWSLRDRKWVSNEKGSFHFVCPISDCSLPASPYPFMQVRGYEVETPEGSIFSRNEVCFIQQCSARELYLRTREGSFSSHLLDQDGFWYCGFCKRIMADQLVHCEDCGRWFKGPRRFFPINYECSDCE